MLPSLLIIDDFLADPMAARKAALKLTYDATGQRGNFPGVNSSEPLEVHGLDERVSQLIGAPAKGDPATSHGHCRITLKGDKGRTGVHIDPSFYSGILYLSLPEHCPKSGVGGTEFLRHKRTGLERVPRVLPAIQAAGYDDINTLVEDVVNQDSNHPAKWERVMRVPIRFNRLILFSPWLFHSAGPAFGTSPDNARLIQLMFFAKG